MRDTTAAGMAAPGADTSMAGGNNAMTGAATAGALTDANIVALLDEANMADSAMAAAALPKATNADVKNFARLMMGEHHALRVQGQDFARTQNITAGLPSSDPFTAAVKAEQDAIASTPKGAAFDSTYIAHEVGIHQAVINWAGTAQNQTQSQPLKDFITKAGPVLQKHLDQAQAIQSRLRSR